MNTGIYVRVSTEEQAHNGYSIRAQEEKLRSYASIKDWSVFDVYADEGISGKNIDGRPGLVRLLHDIEIGHIENVLVYKIDRLTRSTKDLIELIEFFHQYHCSFNSLNEAIDTKTSTGRMFVKIIGIFAEFERENIAERVKLGLERKVREGYTIASRHISYGYQKEKGNKIQSILPKEAKIVKRVYELFLKGYTYTEIAKLLNSEQIFTKDHRKWSYKTVKLLLENPNYIGKVRYGIHTDRYFETLGKHLAIVEYSKFCRVQQKIHTYKNHSNLCLFYHKVRCSCGSLLSVKKYTYVGKKKKSIYFRYLCQNPNCSFKSISERKLEIQFSPFLPFISWNGFSFLEKKKYLSSFVREIILDGKCIKEVIYLHNQTN